MSFFYVVGKLVEISLLTGQLAAETVYLSILEEPHLSDEEVLLVSDLIHAFTVLHLHVVCG